MPDAHDIQDKRRYERFKASLQVRFRAIGAAEKAVLLKATGYAAPGALNAKSGETLDLKQVLSEDISLGGLGISTPQAMVQGTELWINLGLPGVPIPISAIAQVMWSRPVSGGSFQSGLKFTDISQADLAKVESFLTLQKKKG